VTAPDDVPAVCHVIQIYEKATGACLNIRKLKAIAAGSWDTEINMMYTHYCTELTIMGFSFTKTTAQLGNAIWTRESGKVRALARDGYGRDLWLTQRIQYVQSILLTKIWHMAQIFSASK
jgi:hypothetical protein